MSQLKTGTSKAGRKGARGDTRGVADEPNERFDAVGPVVQWSRLGVVLTDLAEATNGDAAAWSAFERLIPGLVEPLRLLEELADLATPALAGETHSRERFAAHLYRVGRAVGSIAGTLPPRGRADLRTGARAGQLAEETAYLRLRHVFLDPGPSAQGARSVICHDGGDEHVIGGIEGIHDGTQDGQALAHMARRRRQLLTDAVERRHHRVHGDTLPRRKFGCR